MADPIMWDLGLLVPCSPDPILKPFNTRGGKNAFGSEKVMGNAPPKWRVVLGDINLVTQEQINKFRQIASKLNGMANPIYVPLCTKAQGPQPASTPESSEVGSVFDDGFGFDDGYGFDDSAPFGGNVWATMTGAVAAGAVTATLTVENAEEIAGGMVFGHGYDYAYSIGDAELVSSADGIDVYTVSFSPPARAAIADGTALNFGDVRVRCTLETDDGMAMPALDLWRFGKATVSFVEDV